MRVVIATDAVDLARRASDHIAGLIVQSAGPRVTLGLAGGSTPRATYRELRAAQVDWSRVDLWLSDERWVAPDHEDSNERMAREELLDYVPAVFHGIPWREGRPPLVAAEEYAWTLETILGDHQDIVVLGMGDDGHTASLFPGTAALTETDADYVANLVPGRGWRLTATIPLLHRSRHTVFLVSGEGKADVLARVLGGERLPSAVVAEGAGDVVWFIDEAAASRLDRS